MLIHQAFMERQVEFLGGLQLISNDLVNLKNADLANRKKK